VAETARYKITRCDTKIHKSTRESGYDISFTNGRKCGQVSHYSFSIPTEKLQFDEIEIERKGRNEYWGLRLISLRDE